MGKARTALGAAARIWKFPSLSGLKPTITIQGLSSARSSKRDNDFWWPLAVGGGRVTLDSVLLLAKLLVMRSLEKRRRSGIYA